MNTLMEFICSKTDDPEVLFSNVPYRSAIGILMYSMICTRPELGFAVGKLSQYCETPLQCRWTSVKSMYRYIPRTKQLSITHGLKSQSIFTVYCDFYWDCCSKSHKSTEGYSFLMTGGTISWSSSKQSAQALSSCEAEYIAPCTAVQESISLSNVISGLLENETL